MLRRTKIVATLGPATDTPESLAAIIKAGVDVTRLNFSHGSAEEHMARARQVREAARRGDGLDDGHAVGHGEATRLCYGSNNADPFRVVLLDEDRHLRGE